MKVNTILADAIYVRGRSDHLSAADKTLTIEMLGITHVVNLWKRADTDLQGSGVEYWHMPMADGRTVPHWVLERAQDLADAITHHGARVLIQCHAGRTRSGLLAAAVLWALTGKSGESCLDYVRTMRPDAVDNDDFETWLDMLPEHPVEGVPE
jgi:hypothetical protein